ncbi:MAG: hypothetical protein ACREMQ_20900 [Longimicrobiales bacterium]
MAHDLDVFLNCPFDSQYEELFWAIIFTIHECGFVARCALEVDDSSDVRIHKIYRIIRESQFGIHDISRTEPDPTSGLPRFNMPLELGLFLGAKEFGSRPQKRKKCLVMDREQYRFQHYCSDIAGQDIKEHGGDRVRAIRVVRDWLRQWVLEPRVTVPGGDAISARYDAFLTAFPLMCQEARVELRELSYVDRQRMTVGWLKEHP